MRDDVNSKNTVPHLLLAALLASVVALALGTNNVLAASSGGTGTLQGSQAQKVPPTDPAVQRLRLPGQSGAPPSLRADHDGKRCSGGAGSDVTWGNGMETQCSTETVGGTRGRLCCPVSCTYRCSDMVNGVGTFKGTCSRVEGASCSFTPSSSPGGGALQSSGPN